MVAASPSNTISEKEKERSSLNSSALHKARLSAKAGSFTCYFTSHTESKTSPSSSLKTIPIPILLFSRSIAASQLAFIMLVPGFFHFFCTPCNPPLISRGAFMLFCAVLKSSRPSPAIEITCLGL
ncbi:hypothetical protein F2P56_035517 [Juglans regia]|uniref:Uncharacterized protein n=1 Tax=Juglans regia TaxID=51240 RepID=A0A833TMK2_JUGRE|nr:hypothetical protein F2P56_035517 [Juglans regia]